MVVRIGNGCGFYGDQLDAPRTLVAKGQLDYLTLEYLAELTLSILARQREKDPTQGFAKDFLYVMESLMEALQRPDAPKIVTNAGGMNPVGCAQAVARILLEAGLGDIVVGVVTGDDLLPLIPSWLEAGERLAHLDDGRPLSDVADRLVSANAYLGAEPIAAALRAGAQIVITGRVADASLTVGPALYEFRFQPDDLTAWATATVAGHLIECGAQVTGGYSTNWRRYRLSDVGYPIAEFDGPHRLTITKPGGTGGAVNLRTVTEQLFYEVGDPSAYLTPDITLDLTQVTLEQSGDDRVAIHGARASAAPDQYKVSAAYRAGFQTAGQLIVYGADCLAKSDAICRIIQDRLQRAGAMPERWHVERIGLGETVPGRAAEPSSTRELTLRIAVADRRREVVERFSRELAPLITSGPAGIGGYTTARQPVRPVYAFWPTLIPKTWIDDGISVTTRRAADWVS